MVSACWACTNPSLRSRGSGNRQRAGLRRGDRSSWFHNPGDGEKRSRPLSETACHALDWRTEKRWNVFYPTLNSMVLTITRVAYWLKFATPRRCACSSNRATRNPYWTTVGSLPISSKPAGMHGRLAIQLYKDKVQIKELSAKEECHVE